MPEYYPKKSSDRSRSSDGLRWSYSFRVSEFVNSNKIRKIPHTTSDIPLTSVTNLLEEEKKKPDKDDNEFAKIR